MPIEMRPIAQRIVQEYGLPLEGCHGVAHWARVYDIGQHLAEASGADKDVVALFALFHDSKRESEGHDPDHGRRGARFAELLRGELFDLSDARLALLQEACDGHTHCRHHGNVTIQACWDSDRLDLGRVGMVPNAYYLNTVEAKSKATMDWAHGRATFHVVPDWIPELWGVEMPLSSID